MDEAAETELFRSFLRSRWGPRSRVLGAYATAGNLVFLVFDLILSRQLPAPPGALAVAAHRLPWALLPVLGGLVAVRAPGWRGLPLLVTGLSVAYTWGNDWTYHVLGLAASPVHALALVICILTAATFLPLALGGRLAVLALQVLGPSVLELAWTSDRPLASRAWTEVAVLCLVACVTAVFENFNRSQRRGLLLRFQLERTCRELEESRARAVEAAAALQRLAAHVCHEVNNPLAAVKVNIGFLAHTEDRGERAEVGAETLAAVQRISVIVGSLRGLASPEGEDDGTG
jgi:signal transduction histidine kinase